MKRHYRYQGAIVREHHILLIQHTEHETSRAYWLLPGGGMEAGESEEECVMREMKEETGLDVRVERLLFIDQPQPGAKLYDHGYKTYLCTPLGGEASPGFEPEPEVQRIYAITQICWVDLYDESSWGEAICTDPITGGMLKKVREALGNPV